MVSPPAAGAVFQGGLKSLVVHYEVASSDGWTGRLVLGAVLALILTTFWLIAPRLNLAEHCQRRPHWIGVLLGLLWWLTLWPSALGWLIIAVSLLSAVRPRWQSGGEKAGIPLGT